MKILLLSLLLCAAPWASAADETPAAQSDGGKAADLAARYEVTEKEVQDLRDKKMGWGEIDNALAISQRSGKPLSDIMKLRDSGMGWGEIAKKEGFTLGEVKRSEKAGSRAEKAEGRADKAASRAEKAESRADKAAGRADKAASRADKAAGRADKAGKGGKN